jgi:hypothetical protein
MTAENKQRLKAPRVDNSRRRRFNLALANRFGLLSRLPGLTTVNPGLPVRMRLKTEQALRFLAYNLSLINQRPSPKQASGNVAFIHLKPELNGRGPSTDFAAAPERNARPAPVPLARLLLCILTGLPISCGQPASPENDKPSVRIELDKCEAKVGEEVPARAIATDPDGRVVKTEFGVAGEGRTAHEASSVDSVFVFTKAGDYQLEARALDDDGAYSSLVKSQLIHVSEQPTENHPPTIEFYADNTMINEGDSVTIHWQAVDPDTGMYALKGVTFNGDFYATSLKDTLLTGLGVGNHEYTAQAIDKAGLKSEEKKIVITVNKQDYPGTLSMTATSGMINEGEDFTVSWDYQDADPEAVTVRVYADNDTKPDNGKGELLHVSSERNSSFSTPATMWNGSAVIYAYVEADQEGAVTGAYGDEAVVNTEEELTDPALTADQGSITGEALTAIV